MDNLEKNITEDILRVWDHAGYDKEVDARLLAHELGKDKGIERGLASSGMVAGRQLLHPQVGHAFGKAGVLGAISNNVKGISVSNLATPNTIAAKKINAGIISKIVYSLVKNDSNVPLWFPPMWKPIINYFLGKIFGDRKISKEDYVKSIKRININESTMIINIDKNKIVSMLQEDVLSDIDQMRFADHTTLLPDAKKDLEHAHSIREYAHGLKPKDDYDGDNYDNKD